MEMIINAPITEYMITRRAAFSWHGIRFVANIIDNIISADMSMITFITNQVVALASNQALLICVGGIKSLVHTVCACSKSRRNSGAIGNYRARLRYVLRMNTSSQQWLILLTQISIVG